MDSPRRVFAWGLAAALGIQLLIHAGFLLGDASGTGSAWQGLPLDDAWIHLVYARNLLEGHELAFNPGEGEVGLTSPLWVALLAPTSTLPGHYPAIAAKIWSLLMALACTTLTALLARRLRGALAGVVAAGVVAIDPSFAFSGVSGMEVCLAAALCLAALLCISCRRVVLAGLLVGLAWLARPETAVVGLLVAVWSVWLCRRGELSRRRTVFGGAVAAGTALPFAIICWSTTGLPFTNTFYLKGSFDPLPLEGLRVLARGVLAESSVLAFGAGLAFILAAVVAAWRPANADRLFVLASPWLFWLGVAATRALPIAEAHTYYYTRYLHPALPLAAVGVGLGCAELLRWATAGGHRSRRQGRVKLAAVFGLGAVAAAAALNLPAVRDRYSWNTRNIEEMQVAAGRWISRSTPRDAVVAASDVGAVRFFCGRRVIDIMGLNYHPVIKTRRSGHIPFGRIMREERPTHLAVLDAWFPELAHDSRVQELFVGRAEKYTIAAAKQDRFVVYEVLRR